eukprot:gene29235-19622_t
MERLSTLTRHLAGGGGDGERELTFTVVDAFTSSPFSGNPAAVVLLEPGHGLSTEFMQKFAREMALSETAYCEKLGGAGGSKWHLRWFTPSVEVDLCGHATLASAHHIFTVYPELLDISFNTKSGVLTAKKDANGSGRIVLDFPEELVEAATLPAGVAAALGVSNSEVEWFGKNRMDWL